MNVPLKKRHNYGINGSASSQNEPTTSANRVHSTNSNDEDDEYDDDHQSSNVDDDDDDDDESSGIGANTTMAHIGKEDRKQQYLNRATSDYDIRTVRNHRPSTDDDDNSSPSDITASTHNSSKKNELNKISSDSSETSDSSDSSKSSKDDAVSEVLSACDPLTEEAVMQHNTDLEPMNSQERIQFWNYSDAELTDDIYNDFDEEKYSSKPIRSERLQKRMYTQPGPKYTSRKSKKDEKSRKTDDKPTSSSPKSKADPKEARKTKASPTKKAKKIQEKSPPSPPVAKLPIPSAKVEQRPIVVNKSPLAVARSPLTATHSPLATNHSPLVTRSPLTHSILLSPVRPLLNNVANRPDNEIPSTIKFRVSYNKDTTIRSDNSFKVPTTPNTSFRSMNEGGCANCNKRSRNVDKTMSSPASSTEIPVNNQKEFYKYLGIDTNPPVQEKVSPEPSPNDALYNNRRSLRVFIQQKQHEYTRTSTKDDQSPHQKSPSTQTCHSPNNVHKHSPDNGNVFTKSPIVNGGVLKTNVISSHIKQRHTYEPPFMDGDEQHPNTNVPTTGKSFNETETTNTTYDANRFGESSGSQAVKGQRVLKRKVLLPSPMMLTEMFKRYKQCFKQGFAIRQQMRHQMVKRVKKRPSNNIQSTEKTSTQTENSTIEINTKINGVQKLNSVQPMNIGGDLINSFSPTSITHSNASTDSAIVVNSNVIENGIPIVTVESACSMQCQQDLDNHVDKSQFRNPLDIKKNGAVHAILTHSASPNDSEVIVVIQESQISFWNSTSKALTMFGIARSWMKIGEITRMTEGKEIDALYQHRLMDIGETFPVYVEIRAKESAPDEFRQSNLTFVYLNVYFVKLNADKHPQIVMECVHLDTIKGYANSIYYTALKTSPSVLMTWTEYNVNNQSRCGIIKYTLKMPTLDNLEDIMDYSDLQHDIKTLITIGDYHVVGCGDRTVSMWDHRNGNLLIDIEIDLPTIGHNIACYTVTIGDDVPDYMLLLQLVSDEGNDESNKQLRVMAVQTVDPYHWRTLQTHDIPNSYGKVCSIFNKDDMLTITFSSGTMLYLNLTLPHQIYIRNVSWSVPQTNGLSVSKCGAIGTPTLFTQSNGQTIEIFNDRIAMKSVWEYFIKKD
ncbi:uncharacterized protein LOC116349739 [Contarinia nasturtii]|uniref:uncharacterized protein LOC116349739 n=1 Tax=Contarinia nasturtii TaxID=265458 RepID=UPI0012D495AB|nr:uncharacterized protein LOC116349739 [Contarinia nasturtii]